MFDRNELIASLAAATERLAGLRSALDLDGFATLEHKVNEPELWRDQDAAAEVMQRFRRQEPLVRQWRYLDGEVKTLRELLDAKGGDDGDALREDAEQLLREVGILVTQEEESRPIPGVADRLQDLREPGQTFLIVCEGEQTEPNYFKAFRFPAGVVRVEGTGRNTESLVQRTIQSREEYPDRDQYWCVFDRDSFKAAQFNNAIQKAESQGFKVAYSNECFEIWYILHFHYYDAATSRALYTEKLTEYLGRPYKKNDKEMYEKLLGKQADAIRNAERLLDTYNPPNPEANNPSTTVHLLVLELNRQLERMKGARRGIER